MTADLILAIDQGTTSTRALAFDPTWQIAASASRRLATGHPQPGWDEQDPAAIVASVEEVVADVLRQVGGHDRIAAVGLANQGESVVAWDSETGAALGPAILWSCRRSQPIVERVAAAGHAAAIRARTGLPLDPYFSAGKMRWLLEEVPAVADAARQGRLAMGTVDAWLTARLGDGARTDPSTASRTQLFQLTTLAWDPELIAIWGLRGVRLPNIGPSTGDLGTLGSSDWGGRLPLRAMLCDQQAALAGHGGQRPGTIKATYGTGVFILANAGAVVPSAPPGILVTVAWTDPAGTPTYAFDGGVFSAGSLLDWLHEGVGFLPAPAELDGLAASVADAGGVRVLPALAGVGAPWWAPDARVVIAGMSAATRPGHLARAVLDAIAQRVADIVEAMDPPDGTTGAGSGASAPIRVDGGLTASTYLVQRQADLLGRPLEIAAAAESTALGVGLMAAIGAGRLTEAEAIRVPAVARRIEAVLPELERRSERDAWSLFARRAIDLTTDLLPSLKEGPP